MKRTVVLIILDGWGIGDESEANPIYVAQLENMGWIAKNYPMTSLQASGISVGLPWGEVGNSEVGHLTLGAGKVVYQYFPKISMAVQDGTFFENAALKSAFAHAKQNGSAVHFVGLLTDANVHASLDHLKALLDMAEREKVTNVKLQLFADGKDSGARSIDTLLEKIPRERLASLTGRYYAMNRSGNFMLTEKVYNCLMGTGGQAVEDFAAALKTHYARGLSEEFLPPLRHGEGNGIGANDAVVFFNFREDSMRQLTQPFLAPDFATFPVKRPENLRIVTMTPYEERFAKEAAFMPDTVARPLGLVLSDAGKTQLRIAETYKYAHVTYFFNGYREPPFPKEYRVLVPSMTVTHPEERPELMASSLTDRLLEAVQNQGFDFVLVNYSNPDTIAHTANYNACVEAAKIIDREIGRILKTAVGTPTLLLITSDHGNLEQVLSLSTGKTETQHDANPVPFYLIGEEFKGRKFSNWKNPRSEAGGILSDVAPTVLELMGVPKPKEMNGQNLLKNLI